MEASWIDEIDGRDTFIGVLVDSKLDSIDRFFKNWKKLLFSCFLICFSIYSFSFFFSEDDLYNWIVFRFDSIHFTRER